MRKLILFIIETKSTKHNTDGLYIKEVFRNYYKYDEYKTLFRFIFMDGKWNYNKKSVLNKIDKEINKFNSAGNGEYHVIYVADKDEYRDNQQDLKYIRELTKFCVEKGYKLVWMDKNIEEAFIGHSVEQKRKVVEAGKFKNRKLIKHIPENKLSDRECNKRYCSNILCILDECLERK